MAMAVHATPSGLAGGGAPWRGHRGGKGPQRYHRTVSHWKPSRPVLVALVVLHVIVTAATLRDISRRNDAQVRGPRWFWRAFTPLQVGNSAVYWLVGRKSTA